MPLFDPFALLFVHILNVILTIPTILTSLILTIPTMGQDRDSESTGNMNATAVYLS